MNFLTNKTPANWRNYSPGGKRRKMTQIPFNGQTNTKLRAMGTKRIPVLANKFSYSYMTIINFAKSKTSVISPVPNVSDNDINENTNTIPTNPTAPLVGAKATSIPIPPPLPFNRRIRYSYLTNEEKRQLTPEQRDVLIQQEREQRDMEGKNEFRADNRNARANYRTLLETSREGRGLFRTLSGS